MGGLKSLQINGTYPYIRTTLRRIDSMLHFQFMNNAYLAAIFDECGHLQIRRGQLAVVVNIYVRNKELAEEIGNEFGQKPTPSVHGDITSGYNVNIASKKALLKLCNVIQPHTVKEPVVNALRDAVQNLYHNRDKEDRKFWLRRLWRVQQKWLDDG